MGCQVGAQRLQNDILNRWGPQTYNAGCFNPNSFYDGTHTPSAHGKGEAIDIGIEPAFRGRHSTGQEIFMHLYRNRGRYGIVQLIWDGQIESETNQPGVIRPYTANPHRDHIHVQFTPQAARNAGLSLSDTPSAPPQEDDVLTNDQQAQLNAAVMLSKAAYETALRIEKRQLEEEIPRAKKILKALTGRSGQVRQIKDRLEQIDAELDELAR